MPRGNVDNLIKNSDLTPEERKEKAKKAGKKSGEVRHEKRQIQDALRKILTGKYEIDGKKVNGYQAMAIQIVKEALSGNVQAFKEIRDTIGEKPRDIVELDSNEIKGIKIKFVDKSQHSDRKEKDPKIIGDYTPPSNIEE